MAYPESIDKFTEKLNKLDNNTYVIEEEVEVTNGVYEGELEHDNISLPSINVYTGSKLTGQKIDNFIVSTPSATPWKTNIKIFSDVSPIYITYETTGDTVEAEDINKVQDSMIRTQTEVDRYKSANDNRATNAENRISAVENNKAEKTYVDTELNKRYLKTETYNKTETDQRIQMVVDAAPAALDTLKEIADALNNDPDFAATITTQLAGKVDKVDGKQLSTEDYTSEEKIKLAGIENNANKYIHPTTHPAAMITEDSTHRWATDAEKTNWNDANSKKHTHGNLSILQSITQALIDAWNSAVDHINDTVKHITSAERTLWNTVSNKVDKSGGTITGQLEIKGSAADRPLVTRGISGTSEDEPSDDLYLNYDSDKVVHIGTTINIDPVNKTINAKSDDSGKLNGQDASYYAQKSHTHDDRYYTKTESDSKFAAKDDLGSAGYGDMLKATYDTDNDGVVDSAETVPWNGISGKPSTFAPSSHTHSISNVTGLQAALDNKMAKGPVTWNDLKGV
ncbi:hypothetical protein [Clostridium sp.]|jgi:hypothetical protein|uniref:hypothetical protein n=1 Tax=Clostridium sp. TaxID=1506 RepID=UPI003A4B5353